MRRFEIGPSQLERPIRDLSHGTKRKLGIVQALMGEPRVAILDEPTSGLDPLMIEAFAETVHALKRSGRTTVFLSSHVLSEVEKTCDRVAIVRDGRLMAMKTIAELSAMLPRRVTIRFSGSERCQFLADFANGNVSVGSRARSPRRLGARPPGRGPHRAAGAAARTAGRPPGRGHRRPRSLSRGLRPWPLPGGIVRPPLLATLVGRSLARGRRVFVAAGVILAGFQVMLVVVASSFQQTRSFDLLSALMPMGVQQALGPGTMMLASFAGMVTFGYFHPVVVFAVLQLGSYAATEPAGEVEWGLFDLELARPVSRRTIVTRSAAVAFGVTLVTVGAMMAGTWAGLAALAPAGATWPAPARVLSLSAHLLLLSWVFAAAGLAAGAWARRRGTAFGAIAVITVVLYLANFLADAWPRAASFRPWTPFHYFPGFAVANGAAPIARDLGTLAAVSAVLVALAYWRFSRRDL